MSSTVARGAPRELAPSLAIPWQSLVAGVILIVLFIPIRRYTLPGRLPFDLEPYRLAIALLAAAWLASLLADPRVRLRLSGFEGPLVLLATAIVGSLLIHPDRVAAVGPIVVKKLMFQVSFVIVFYLIVSVVRRLSDIDFLCRVLVTGAAVVALFATVESQTDYNLFNHLHDIIPLLKLSTAPDAFPRGTGIRAYASAQHPIALGAALVIVLPLAVYLQRRTEQRRWWIAATIITVGMLTTVSRTAILMLGVALLVLICLRPRESWRLLAWLVIILVIVQVAIPGAVESLKESFVPHGGLITEQAGAKGTLGQGRVADLAPALGQAAHQPLLGKGFGTLIPVGPQANTLLLDDQWLETLLETGVVGVIALAWLALRLIRRASQTARRDDSPRGWLLAALAASIAAYAVGMFTFDAFSFIQVTFLFYILLGLGAALLLLEDGARQPRGLAAVRP
jgi:O-Antigen ligase